MMKSLNLINKTNLWFIGFTIFIILVSAGTIFYNSYITSENDNFVLETSKINKEFLTDETVVSANVLSAKISSLEVFMVNYYRISDLVKKILDYQNSDTQINNIKQTALSEYTLYYSTRNLVDNLKLYSTINTDPKFRNIKYLGYSYDDASKTYVSSITFTLKNNGE